MNSPRRDGARLGAAPAGWAQRVLCAGEGDDHCQMVDDV